MSWEGLLIKYNAIQFILFSFWQIWSHKYPGLVCTVIFKEGWTARYIDNTIHKVFQPIVNTAAIWLMPFPIDPNDTFNWHKS